VIKGFRGVSLVDYPGKVCSVIYTGFCNFRCPYCYNVDLVLPERVSKLPDISEDRVVEELGRRRGFVEAVTITGGEPTLWGERLVSLIRRIKRETELLVKLDTNGSNPGVVKGVLEDVDFFAVDFKTSPKRYSEVKGNFKDVEETFNVLRVAPEKVEIRITFYPPLISEEDLKEMLPYLEGFRRVALQKFVPERTLSEQKVAPYPEVFYRRVEEVLREYLPEVRVVERF